MGKSRKKKKTETPGETENESKAASEHSVRTKNTLAEENAAAFTSSTNSADVSEASNAQTCSIRQGSSKKRKRKRPPSNESKSQQSHNDRTVFNGLTLAISTLESKTNDKEESDEYNNFKTLSFILKTNGAIISPQVHKRVHYLVCTQQAVDNLTQRVRQALKRNVDIVNVEWVKSCIKNGSRVNAESYMLNDLTKELMSVKEKEKAEAKHTQVDPLKDGYESDIPSENASGWSEPIALDCCCVCHENGDENCPWCADCNINLAKLKK